MDYLPTLGEKWPHSRGNVGKYSIHGSYGNHPFFERRTFWMFFGEWLVKGGKPSAIYN